MVSVKPAWKADTAPRLPPRLFTRGWGRGCCPGGAGGARLKLQGWADCLGEAFRRSPRPSPGHQSGGYQYQLRGDSAMAQQ